MVANDPLIAGALANHSLADDPVNSSLPPGTPGRAVGPSHPRQWVTLESKKVTSLSSYFAGLASRCADIICMQEQCCSLPVLQRLGAELSHTHGRVLVAGPPDPNLEQPAAGVATIGRSTDTVCTSRQHASRAQLGKSPAYWLRKG